MIKEEKIEFTAKWCKYSKYNIEKKDEQFYIVADKNAIPGTYDPFEIRNLILKDLLVIGKESVGNNTSISALEFEKKYFWKDSKIDWSKTMKSNDYHRNAGPDDYFKQTEGDRLDDIIFSKNYAETISEIIDFATTIYDIKLLICAYLYDDVSDDIKEVYQNSITSHSLKKCNISYGIEKGQIKFKWNFMSLSEIIETILLLNETSGRTEVKLCKHCGKPFIAKNIKAEYDTIQCRNRENINKSRQKKNNFIE